MNIDKFEILREKQMDGLNKYIYGCGNFRTEGKNVVSNLLNVWVLINEGKNRNL